MGLNQTKNLYRKRQHQQMKSYHIEWGKKCVNHISVKGLISKISKELIQLNNEEMQVKWTKDLTRPFPKNIYSWPISTQKDAQHY